MLPVTTPVIAKLMTQTAQPASHQTGPTLAWPRPPLAPRWFVLVPQTTFGWSIVYVSLRIWWTLHGTPSFGRLGFDLMFFFGPRAMILSAAAAVLAIALRTSAWSRVLLLEAWIVCIAHLIACPLLLLDLVSLMLPGLGVSFSPAAFFSRSACLIEGVLVGLFAIAYRRRWRSDCLFCGQSAATSRPQDPPRWARWAAYAAVAGCLLRLIAQYAFAFGDLSRHMSSHPLVLEALIFEAGFLLAGIVLPLALVHRWGRVLPRCTPLVGSCPVPRWLVLAPAFALSTLMVPYFSITLLKMITDTLSGKADQSLTPFPPAFFWVAVPAYLAWGIGLGIAAISYYRMTRPKCLICGR